MKRTGFAIIAAVLIAFACKSGKSQKISQVNNENKRTAKLETLTKNGITLTELYSPEQFENATLQQEIISSYEDLDTNTIALKFTTTNYEFGVQTDTTGLKNCANSAKGQHVHTLVDNGPYNALYTPMAKVKANNDGQHIVLSFLSRSYHESIKNKNAYVLTSAITGKSRIYSRFAQPDLSKPMLFYSRPKGEYTGNETDAVLLDFYLVNCDLAKDGYKVKAEINGTEFMLTKWAGYFMEGLPKGKNVIRLTLLDAIGNAVENQFNPIERTIVLK